MKIKSIQMITTLMITNMALLILLTSFSVYSITNQNSQLMVEQQAYTQIARANVIAKDIVVITYNPTRDNSQFVSDLQVILPLIQKTQDAFSTGDASLGIAGNPTDTILQALQLAQSNYLSLVTAAKVVAANPTTQLNSIEVNIVLNNVPQYSTNMSNIALLYRQDAYSTNFHLLIIKIVLCITILSIQTFNYGFARKHGLGSEESIHP